METLVGPIPRQSGRNGGKFVCRFVDPQVSKPRQRAGDGAWKRLGIPPKIAQKSIYLGSSRDQPILEKYDVSRESSVCQVTSGMRESV